MPSIKRPLSGDVLVFDLDRERSAVRESLLNQRSRRSARTLLKEGPLRITMVVLAAGAEVAEHHASGPITIVPLEGRITFITDDGEHELGADELLTAGAGVPHRVRSEEGATFLLTVVNEPAKVDP